MQGQEDGLAGKGLCKPKDQSFFPGPTWWNERTYSSNLPSDFHKTDRQAGRRGEIKKDLIYIGRRDKKFAPPWKSIFRLLT